MVILTDSGTIYWPIADTTPSSGQNDRLLPFAGQKVTASGKVFERRRSKLRSSPPWDVIDGIGIHSCPLTRYTYKEPPEV